MRFHKADAFESSTRLLWGFLGAFLVSAIGKFFEGSRNSTVWLFALLVLLVVTSFGQSLLAAAYNGFVSGLFFNFFFSSSNQELSFESSGDVWLEVLFVVVGITAGLISRWIPIVSIKPDREPEPQARREDADLMWKSRASDAGPADSNKKEENEWTP